MSVRALAMLVLAVSALAAGAMAQAVRRPPMTAPLPKPADTGPTVANAGLARPALSLAAPTDLTSTVDPQVCTQHGGFGAGLGCKTSLPLGRLALVWNWTNAGLGAAGFHVYRVDGGLHDDVADTGADVTTAILAVPFGECFAVSAYGGGQESDLSPPYCPADSATVRTLGFPATFWRSASRSRSEVSRGDPETDLGRTMWVGYEYWTIKTGVFGDGFLNTIYRTGLMFDLSKLAGHKIVAAHLVMTVENAWDGGGLKYGLRTQNPPTDHYNSCIAKIDVGSDDWSKYSSWFDSGTVLTPGRQVGPEVSIDVTPIVSLWANGQTNYGFVLEGEEENLGAFTEKTCVSQYADARLVVEFQ